MRMASLSCNLRPPIGAILVYIFLVCVHQAHLYQLFSTKTPYAWSHPPPEAHSLKRDDLYRLPGVQGMSCSAVHASGVFRHGARYPGSSDIKEINSIHGKLKAAMTEKTNPDLFSWVDKFPAGVNRDLTSLGQTEQENLGSRTATKLASLFTRKSSKNFQIFVSSEVRTVKSAEFFKKGFINMLNESAINSSRQEVDNMILRFYDSCQKYLVTVEDNQTAFTEVEKFRSSDLMVKIRDKVQERLGLKETLLSTDDVRLMYLICGYEKGLHNTSPWCSPFQDDDMLILTYGEDLNQYYKNGYRYDITWQQSCPMFTNIFKNMDAIVNKSINNEAGTGTQDVLVGQFAFGHAETLGPIFSSLGLFKDPEPLRADNYNMQLSRKFNTSNILPFSSNILFVLYQCVPGTPAQKSQAADFYLKMFVNEEATVIPGCQNLSCPYNQVRDRYQDRIDHCNFQQICQWPPPSNVTSAVLAQTLVAVLGLVVSVCLGLFMWL